MRDLIESLRADAELIHNNGITRKLPRHRVAALLREAAAALESAREDVKAVGTVLGGEFHYLRPSHGLPDGTMLYAIDQARWNRRRRIGDLP